MLEFGGTLQSVIFDNNRPYICAELLVGCAGCRIEFSIERYRFHSRLSAKKGRLWVRVGEGEDEFSIP